MNLDIFHIDSDCTGCGACVNVCPKQCIALKPNSEGFYYPESISDACIGCKMCEKACHILNPISTAHVSEDGFVLYRSEVKDVIESSSSGGIFTLLAEHILDKGGAVFGSYFNPDTERLEVASSEDIDWHLFRKSKYVETYTGHTFNHVAELLVNGQKVLYCSTPCQIRGLVQYLIKKKIERTQLVTVDLICHGVPSAEFFHFFYKRHVNRHKSLKELNFRHKDFKTNQFLWHNPAIVFNYTDGSRDVFSGERPSSFQYIRFFNDNLSLRKSCYTCKYPEYSYADFTIADFWGITEYKPQYDDNRGISLVKMNTAKAVEVWNSLKEKEYSESVDYRYGSYVYNKLDKSSILPARDMFYQNASRWGYFPAVFLTYRGKVVLAYIKYWIKLLIGRRIN